MIVWSMMIQVVTGTVILDQRRPVQVLHEGRWLDGWLEAYRREASGWRRCVPYSEGVGMTYYQWRHESELRRHGLKPARHSVWH